MQTRVIITEHARERIPARGDGIMSVVSEIRALSSQIVSTGVRAGSRRVALESPDLATIPIIEISPRRYGIGLIVITALPRPARSIPLPVLHRRQVG